jgi:hypothetical protein
VTFASDQIEKQLANWRGAAKRFRQVAELDNSDAGGARWRWTDVGGSRRELPARVVQSWRRELAAMTREARRRARAGDWEWFGWVSRFMGAVRAEESETFEELYALPLLRAEQKRQGHAAGGRRSAAARGGPGSKTSRIHQAADRGLSVAEIAKAVATTKATVRTTLSKRKRK